MAKGSKEPQDDGRVTCPPDVWKQLVDLHFAFKDATEQEADGCTRRKAIEDSLEEATEGKVEYTELCVEHYKVLRQIETARSHKREIADRTNATIGEGIEGRLYRWDVVNVQPKPEPPAPLYHDPADKLKDVREAAANAPAPKGPPPSWHAGKVDELDARGVADRVIAALKRAGITTLGELVNCGSRFTAIHGITPGDEQALEDALEQIDPDWLGIKSKRVEQQEAATSAPEPETAKKQRGRPPGSGKKQAKKATAKAAK